MKRKQLRVAVIGLGAAGQHHCRSIAEHVPEMRLSAVVESAAEVGRQTAEKYAVPWFASCQEMLDAGVAEAVTIATPHPSHAALAVQCARAGKHVLTEKPMAVTIGEAERMLQAARKAKVALGCVFQMRFEPAVVQALRAVRTGQLGEITRTVLIFNDYRTQAYYDSNVWRATWKGEGGGVLLNQAPHHLDVFTLLAGLPTTVLGRLGTRLHNIEVEDHAEAMLRYANGATGYLLCSTNEPCHGWYIEIAGDRGKIVLGYDVLRIYRYDRSLREMTARAKGMWDRPKVTPKGQTTSRTEGPHGPPMRNFARHVLFGEALRCDAATAAHSLELANAITLSHFQGREVALPISRRAYEAQIDALRAKSVPKTAAKVVRHTDPRMR